MPTVTILVPWSNNLAMSYGGFAPTNQADPWHNDHWDAYRHTLVSATLASNFGQGAAKYWMDQHEANYPNPSAEKNMDLWNNNVGREEYLRWRDATAAGETSVPLSRWIYDAVNSGKTINQPIDHRSWVEPEPVVPMPDGDPSTGMPWPGQELSTEPPDFIPGDKQEYVKAERQSAIDEIARKRREAEEIFENVISPLVLDLDGNGVESLSIAAGIRFDHDGNGFGEQTGWVGPGDGLLALDLNGNGQIDSGAELFGNFTVIPNSSLKSDNGFIALAQYDSNRDRRIDSADAVFTSLKVWVDANSDGVSSPAELLTLQQANVQYLNVDYETSSKVDSSGNERRQIGYYVQADGQARQLHDVWFQRDTATNPSTNFSAVTVPDRIDRLPDVEAFGSLRSLHEAMALDSILEALVANFVSEPDIAIKQQLVDSIIMRWTGADRVTFGTDSPYYDERKLFALDVASGEAVYDRNYNERPNAGPLANAPIEAGYSTFRTWIYRVLSESSLTTVASLDQFALEMQEDGGWTVTSNYQQRRAENPRAAVAELIQQVMYGHDAQALGWDGVGLLRTEIAAYESDAAMMAFIRSMGVIAGDGELGPVDPLLPAVFIGKNGNDALAGTLYADTFDGGGGDDYLGIGAGDDIHFGVGSGHDRTGITGGQHNNVWMKAGVRPEDVVVSRGDSGASGFRDLVLTLSSGDSLNIQAWSFENGDQKHFAIDAVHFSDGTVWTSFDLQAKVPAATAGNDVFAGTFMSDLANGGGGNDQMFGNGGNDVLIGGDGNDALDGGRGQEALFGGMGDDLIRSDGSRNVIDGGAGNDTIQTNSSRDTYYFGRGSGQDTLNDFDGLNRSDVLIVGPEVSTSDISAKKVGGDLVIGIVGTNDQLRITGWFSQVQYRIETVLFDDGTAWTTTDLVQNLQLASEVDDVIVGTDAGELINGLGGNDEIYGQGGNDTLIGGSGNDCLRGGAGNDTYLLERGSGSDVIYDSVFQYGAVNKANDIDVLMISATASELVVERGGYRSASLFIRIIGTTDQVEIAGWFDQDDSNTLRVQLQGGTVWDAAALRSRATPPATDADLYLYGSPSADTLSGNAQDNVISAAAGNDVLDGGGGNDTLYGGSGRDTYVFGFGSGQDRIIDQDYTEAAALSVDVVQMKTGVRPQDVTLTRNGQQVVLTMAGGDDTLTFAQYRSGERVEEVRFSDGTVWNLAVSPSAPIDGTAGTDTLYGTEFDDVISAGAGNDTLYAQGGNDQLFGQDGNDMLIGTDGASLLDGGAGSDRLYGGAGDRFVFGRGYGQDVIYTAQPGTAVFKEGVLPSDIRVTGRTDSTLEILIAGSADMLTLAGWFSAVERDEAVNRFEFADGTVWGESEIRAHLSFAGTSGDDYQYSGATSSVMFGEDGNDQLFGNLGNDSLNGGLGNDSLNSGAGNDTLEGGAGADALLGGIGSDTYILGAGFGQDNIYEADSKGVGDVNRIVFTADIRPQDIIVTGDNQFTQGGEGNLYLTVLGTANKATLSRWFDPARSNVDRVEFADGTVWSRADLVSKYYALERGGEMEGTDAADTLLGDGSDDSIDGGFGNDALSGRGGNDDLFGGAGNDSLNGGSGYDNLYGGIGDDTYVFERGSGRDTIGDFDRVSGSRDRIMLGASIAPTDVVVARDDAYIYLSLMGTNDQLRILWYPNAGFKIEEVSFTNGAIWDATILESMAQQWLSIDGGGDQNLTGTANADVLVGGSSNDTLSGLAGDDSLSGLDGDDRLDGGAGSDTLIGGSGDDTYVIDSASDIVTENTGEGTDIAESSVTLALATNVENLTLTGTVAVSGTGNAAENVLIGNSANNTLDGGAGNDVLVGGAGNDTYVVDATADVVTELASEGTDLVQSSATGYILSANVENLTLNGTGTISGTGNDLDNVLIGNSANNILTGAGGNDTLDGRAGNDTLVGGSGNDTYVVNVSSDVVTELADEGTDTIQSTVSWSLSSTTNVENLTLIGTGIINATGNASTNVLTGNVTNNVLDGGAGIDVLIGGAGNDTYVVDATADVVTEFASEGTDLVQSIAASYTLGANVENLTLTGTGTISGTGNGLDNVLIGNSANNTLTGAAGNDSLDGGAGNDTLIGGAGNDTYVVNVSTDIVTELSNEGTDTVQSAVTWSLNATANIENVTLTGNGTTNATGNAAANVLIGNAADNTLTGAAGDDILDGGLGNDTLVGGAGNDVYVVNVATDVVTENASEGSDTVQSAVTFTLGTNVENLTLTGVTAINATGNTLGNVLTGNAAANTLNGGTGADTMAGGAGDDIFVVDNAADLVIENAAEGIDVIQSAVTYTLAANVENLTLTGTTVISATGNTLDNVLIGNSANNTLTGGAGNDTADGGAGNDTMLGGAGNDVYVVDVTTDVITENAGEGVDTVQSAITWTLGSNLENLVLSGTSAVNGTGNTSDNVLTGNSAANTLSGAAGADTMVGAAGNDTYVVDNVGDVIIENASEGTDLVQAGVTFTLSANVENLTLTGTGAINGAGNALANALIGNSGINRLDGGSGADSMTGGAGNDTYVVDNSGDTTVEAASGGTDTVEASITWTISTEVENLTLTGTGAINATGNTLANTLRGNVGNNILDGGTGNDTMVGSAGDDVYKVDAVADVVTEIAGEGRDRVESTVTLTLASNVEDLTLLGTTAINGTGNTLDNTLIGNSAANNLTGGAGNDSLNGNAGADTMVGGAGDDAYYVDVTTDVTTELVNEGTDAVNSTVAWTLGSNLENLTLLGTAAVNGAGNTLNNVVTGNSAANTLTGNAGNDTLDGDAGADTLIGGAGNDKYMMGRGYGAELVQENDATAGNTDVMQFLSGVASDQIWFRKVSNDLEVSIIGTTDKTTVQNWYLGSQYRVEQFKTSDGKTLLDSKVQDLVSAMAAFTPPAAGQTTLPSNYQTTLLPVIAADWGP